MANDFGFAILVVILGRFFQYMDGDFGALQCMITVALVHLCTILHLLIWVFFYYYQNV